MEPLRNACLNTPDFVKETAENSVDSRPFSSDGRTNRG